MSAPRFDSKAPYPTAVEPVELWCDRTLVYLQYKMEAVQRMNRRFGKSMLGFQGSIMELDESMLPGVLMEGIVDENGHRFPGKVDDAGRVLAWLIPEMQGEDGEKRPALELTESFFSQLPVGAWPYLHETWMHAWNGSMPVSKKKRLARMEPPPAAAASETTEPPAN